MTSAPLSRHEVEAKIVKRCWENDAFHKEFVSDPAGCFAKYLNAAKAQLPKIVVHEEQPGSWHIVLPSKPAKASQLSDEELEKVAGGTDVAASIIVTVFASNAGLATAIMTGTASSGGW